MRLLLDTHLLLWAMGTPERLPLDARSLIADLDNEILFSAACVWEIAIKSSRQRADFQVDARVLRRRLLDNSYLELPVTGEHAIAIASLPPIHKDPFDRIMVAQATVEGVTFLTSDAILAQYSGPVRLV